MLAVNRHHFFRLSCTIIIVALCLSLSGCFSLIDRLVFSNATDSWKTIADVKQSIGTGHVEELQDGTKLHSWFISRTKTTPAYTKSEWVEVAKDPLTGLPKSEYRTTYFPESTITYTCDIQIYEDLNGNIFSTHWSGDICTTLLKK